ncbi:hypothetical protein [Candidatus Cytomitobacter primus]|nr:hypothetical protein [Candidatus Cytomitobacter primus]
MYKGFLYISFIITKMLNSTIDSKYHLLLKEELALTIKINIQYKSEFN